LLNITPEIEQCHVFFVSSPEVGKLLYTGAELHFISGGHRFVEV
jgi:hypothetical protein